MSVLRGQTVVIASHNPGKIAEFARLLEPLGAKLISAGDLNLPEPDEPGTTFTQNAMLKARIVAAASGLIALADDSGLAVTALNGEPGVQSARWAGPEKDFMLAMRRVEEGLAGKRDRSAAFVTMLALCVPGDKGVGCFPGEVRGRMIWPPRGTNGFGYDPVFVPDGETRTFGEMTTEEKAGRSHRAKACAMLLEKYRG